MIVGTHKSHIDAFWNRMAGILVWMGLTPNQVTAGGLVLVGFSCVHYAVYQSNLWFGVLLALSLTADGLDGAVARLTSKSSKFGAYFDGVVDRYQEVLIFHVIALVNGWWNIAYLAITGSLLISYNKARTALEIPVRNENWPDLLERLERLIWIVASLILDGLFPGRNLLWWGIALLAILAHITAVQRFLRARRMILGWASEPQAAEAAGTGGDLDSAAPSG